MADRVTSYGHTYQKAVILSRIADQEATRQRKGPRASTPLVLPQSRPGFQFINNCGEQLPAYGIFRLDTPTTIDGVKFSVAKKVDSTYRWRYGVNVDEAIDDGKMGFATWLSESYRVLYDTGSTPAIGQQWGPKNGEFKVFQYRPGFWVDGPYDSDDGWMIAQQIIPQEVLVQNDTGSDKSAASSATYGLYGGATQGSETSLGLSVTAWNRTSTTFKSGKFGQVAPEASGNYVSPQEQ